MNYAKIDGISFDVKVAISDYDEYFNVLDGENAGRALSGKMIRDVIGTYIGHRVTFFATDNRAGFDELWDYLLAHSVDDSIRLEAADNQTSISYDAYYTSGSRKLKKVENGVNYWDEIQINFIPIDAQLRP